MVFRVGLRASAFCLSIAALGVLIYVLGAMPVTEPGLRTAKTGVVLDAATGRPLSGVYVVARWLEQSSEISFIGGPGEVKGQCLYRKVVRTDEQGRYEIPAGDTNFATPQNDIARQTKYFWDAYAYAPGYAVSGRPIVNAVHPQARADSSGETQTLEPIQLAVDHAAASQRIDTLAETLSRFTCRHYAPEPVAVAEQVYAEAYAMACLPEPNDAAPALARLRDDAARLREPAQEPCARFRQASNVR